VRIEDGARQSLPDANENLATPATTTSARHSPNGRYALPIIALTADPTTMYHEEALEAGCAACLAKPFKLAELRAAIRRASHRGR